MHDRAGVLALAFSQTIVWAGLYYAFPALLPVVAADTGRPVEAIATIFSATLLAAAAGAPLAGALIDRGLGQALLPGAAALGGGLLILCGWLPGAAAFTAVWVLIGLCQAGALYDPAFSVLTRAYGAGARAPITTVTLIAGFAGTLSFPLCHYLAGIGGWRLAMQGMGGLILVAGVPLAVFALRRIGTGPEPEPRGAPRERVFGRRAFWALAAAIFLLTLHTGAVLSHILPLLADRGVAPGTAVLAAASIGPMQVAGRLALLRFGGEADARRLAVFGWGAILLSAAALGFAGLGAPVLALFVLLFGAGNGVMSILRPLLVRDILGARGYGRKAGLVASAAMLGGALAPAAGGAALAAAGGYGLMLTAGATALLIGLAALAVAAYAPRAEA